MRYYMSLSFIKQDKFDFVQHNNRRDNLKSICGVDQFFCKFTLKFKQIFQNFTLNVQYDNMTLI